MLFGQMNEEDKLLLSRIDIAFQSVQLKYDSLKEEKTRKISLSFSVGFFAMDPVDEIEQAMIKNGFGNYSPRFFGGTNPHPKSYISASWNFQFNYLLNKISSFGFMLSKSTQGETIGYDAQSFSFLNLQYQTTTWAPIYIINLKNDKHNFLLGPSINVIKTYEHYGDYKNSITKLGLVGGYSVKPVNEAKSFIELSLNYRLMGNIEIGPITKTSAAGKSVFSATEFNFSHLYIGIGYGRKFQ